MMHTETLKTIKKLTLMTSTFLTVSVTIFGIIALLLVFKLNYRSAHVFSGFFDAMSWWIVVLIGVPIAGYVATNILAPSLIQKVFYTDLELQEESLTTTNQMRVLEEKINTLVTVVNQCLEVANLCSESARECGVSANESRTATGKLEDEIRGLKQAAGRVYDVTGMLDVRNDVLGAKITELGDHTASLDKVLVDLENNREKVLEEAMQPIKNSLLALRKENVQLHRTSAERIKSLEDGGEDMHEFLLELVHNISSAYRSHEDSKRIT